MKNKTNSKAYYFLKTGAISKTFSAERVAPDFAAYLDNVKFRKVWGGR